MAKGGARARSGPPPSPDALRRERDSREWTKLPGVGRQADPPDWPEVVQEPSVAELAMWARLWRSPQALVWEADGVADTVALYCRTFLEASQPQASGATRTFVRQLQDALLLSIPALHAARYVIDRDLAAEEAPPVAGAQTLPMASGEGSVRDRFRVVPPLTEDDPSD